jgi:hypothetical protein
MEDRAPSVEAANPFCQIGSGIPLEEISRSTCPGCLQNVVRIFMLAKD